MSDLMAGLLGALLLLALAILGALHGDLARRVAALEELVELARIEAHTAGRQANYVRRRLYGRQPTPADHDDEEFERFLESA